MQSKFELVQYLKIKLYVKFWMEWEKIRKISLTCSDQKFASVNIPIHCESGFRWFILKIALAFRVWVSFMLQINLEDPFTLFRLQLAKTHVSNFFIAQIVSVTISVMQKYDMSIRLSVFKGGKKRHYTSS